MAARGAGATAGESCSNRLPRVQIAHISRRSLSHGLAELGWIEGQNIVIEQRFAAGDTEQLKGAAAELIRLRVDVIVAAASAATKVAKEATASIPIVFANAGDPVGQGFVQSLPRPGGNLTGI